MTARALDVAVYEPKLKADSGEGRTMVSFRIDNALKERLELLTKFWNLVDKGQFGDKAAVTTMTDAYARTIKAGIENSWAEFGLEPTNEKEMQALAKKAVAARRALLNK